MRDPGAPADRRRRWAMLAGLVLLLAVPPLVTALDRDFYVSVMSRVLVLSLAAVALDLVLGLAGLVSFGHAAFVGVGAYAVLVLARHAADGAPLIAGWTGTTQALLAWPLAALAAGLAAALIGWVSLRTSGVFFIMITLAFAQMLHSGFATLDAYGGSDGMSLPARSELPGLDLSEPWTFYYLVLAILAALVWLGRRLAASRFGAVLAGVRENERRMLALGFPTRRYKLAAFALSGAVAGLAGALLANQTEYVSPAFMHWTRSGELIVMVVLGGMGTVYGPVLGALAFLLLEEGLAEATEHWMLILGPLLLLVALAFRGGLAGLIERAVGGRPR